MKRSLLGLTLVLLAASPGIAQTRRLPGANANGDWIGPSRHRFWQAVDPDPNGLNCRMRGSFQAILNARYRNIRPDVLSMPVVDTLRQYSTFVAGTSPVGNVLIEDNRGLPWIYNADEGCFVRGNERFVRPMIAD